MKRVYLETKYGVRRELEHYDTALNQNHEFRLFALEAAYGDILIVTCRRIRRGEILILILRAPHEGHAV
jgi:hypothetical protein